MDKTSRSEYRRRISMIFRHAIVNEYQLLVLPALGCGNYQIPLGDVVEIVCEVVRDINLPVSFQVITYVYFEEKYRHFCRDIIDIHDKIKRTLDRIQD